MHVHIIMYLRVVTSSKVPDSWRGPTSSSSFAVTENVARGAFGGPFEPVAGRVAVAGSLG